MIEAQEFARWYRAVDLQSDLSHHQARMQGVDAIVRDADRDDLETLLRLVFPTKRPPTRASAQAIRRRFAAVDDTFPMENNDRELQILAAICLVALINNGDAMGAAAALAVTTASFGGARRPNLPVDIGVFADQAIDRMAHAAHERPHLDRDTPWRLPASSAMDALASSRDEGDYERLADAVESAVTHLKDALEATLQRCGKEVTALTHQIQVQDEELEMLWWLTGQRSSEQDRPFQRVPLAVRPLVLAKELADSTHVLPGPPSLRALLSRAGLKSTRPVRISIAIDAAAEDWLERLLGDEDPCPVSSPLHSAMKRKTEAGSPEVWVPAWSGMAGIPSEHSLSPLDLGVLFYRERLLLRD